MGTIVQTDEAMKNLKKGVADFVVQATEQKLSKYAILIFSKQKTKETIEIDNAYDTTSTAKFKMIEKTASK
jgi:hypothetical protein